MDKLKELQDLETKLQTDLSKLDVQIAREKAALGSALVKQAAGLPDSSSAVKIAQTRVDTLVSQKQAAEIQLEAIPAVTAELKPKPDAKSAQTDRHAKIQQAQKDYNRLWGKLNLRAGRTSQPGITPEVRQAFEDLLEAGRILKNTNKIGDLAQAWGLRPDRDVYGGCTGFSDGGRQKYGDWNPPAPVNPPPWQPPVFASFAKRLKLSEKHLLQLYVQFQKESGNTAVGWTTQTRARFHKWQDWLEDDDYVPKPDFKPPSQDDLCSELNMSEKSLRNRFKTFKAENGIPNSYRHLTSSHYQQFREFLDNTPVAKYGGGVQR